MSHQALVHPYWTSALRNNETRFCPLCIFVTGIFQDKFEDLITVRLAVLLDRFVSFFKMCSLCSPSPTWAVKHWFTSLGHPLSSVSMNEGGVCGRLLALLHLAPSDIGSQASCRGYGAMKRVQLRIPAVLRGIPPLRESFHTPSNPTTKFKSDKLLSGDISG